MIVLGCIITSEMDGKQSDTCVLTDNVPPVVNAPPQPSSLKSYIIHVINYGSNQLNYPAGAMESGYVSPEDAPLVAEYVLYFMKHKRTVTENVKKGNLLYNGNCGGCHGDDGAGLEGAFPRLDQATLQGYEP